MMSSVHRCYWVLWRQLLMLTTPLRTLSGWSLLLSWKLVQTSANCSRKFTTFSLSTAHIGFCSILLLSTGVLSVMVGTLLSVCVERFILLRMRTKISATLGWLIHCSVMATLMMLCSQQERPWILDRTLWVRENGHSLTHPPTHLLTQLTYSLTQLIHSLTHSLTHPLTHPLTHSHTHSLTHTSHPPGNRPLHSG